MKLMATSLSIGMLLLPTQAQLQRARKVIHLAEVTCKTFVEEMEQEQGIIVAWLQGYYTPENDPLVIDVHKLLSDSAKLTEHCVNNPEDDIMMASDAVFGK
jgi:acid stress chaperone HdeB